MINEPKKFEDAVLQRKLNEGDDLNKWRQVEVMLNVAQIIISHLLKAKYLKVWKMVAVVH